MFHIIDIGGAPANEECAQLGQTIDFEAANTHEVMAYKLAIIARHGMPPEGCKLIVHTNRHDFGIYRTLALKVEDEENEAVEAYAEAVNEGLGSWNEAGFTAPVTYTGHVAKIERSDHTELVIGALLTTRPNADGTFPIDDFGILHGHLEAAFPEQADTARQRLTAA
ncbi:hypothetical protein [Sphingomonas sp. PP-CC-3G-468]|uniref:hypothetical protein n=1 Tax=Sphingomonas sp. PP-CC-3G-468 TaxID=2135656 RepID=UPI00104F381D|nr:hypothetical protein [Sphingomonas sp. PP-CC-3G-468]TCM02169.1 hypothetical protein C8J41_11526 [Sphingomonas sp. PP-CC-3G-468]